jgi:phage tail sheath gpL-like
MSSSLVITINSDRADIASIVKDTSADKEGIISLANFLRAGVGGNANMSVDAQYNASAAPVAASGTLTLVSAIATDAITIGTQTFTFSSTPANENQVEVDGASDTADAAALAAAINAHSVMGQIVSASSALGVVTITALQKGVVGNMIALSSADATITASAATLTGGTGGACSASVTYSAGL